MLSGDYLINSVTQKPITFKMLKLSGTARDCYKILHDDEAEYDVPKDRDTEDEAAIQIKTFHQRSACHIS
jgi:hypothetical protein